MIKRLVFAGEAIVDLVMTIPALPERGGDVIADDASFEVGGGFNVMAAAARQGMHVVYAGGHGTGRWGELVRAALAAEHIAVLRPQNPDRDTGFDVTLVEQTGERTFVTSLGAETLREPGSWGIVAPATDDAVYISGYGLVPPGSGAVLGQWAAALPRGVTLFVDPGPLAADIPATVLDPVLARCDWWSCNQREGELLTGAPGPGAPDPAEAARRLLARTTRANVIVRAGAAGCALVLRDTDNDPVTVIRAPDVTPVDTTGAGDTHSGVFLASLAEGMSAEAAVYRANAAAALSVTRPGPATSPTCAELDAWLASLTRR
jgi:sugar/nucleoside kinase (ribokinase family)